MRTKLMLVVLTALIWSGCSLLSSQVSPSSRRGNARPLTEGDLQLLPTQAFPTIEWNVPFTLPLSIRWGSGQKRAVQISAVAETPAWLHVDIQPLIVDPPATAVIQISIAAGQAPLGLDSLVLEAMASGFTHPVRVAIPFVLRHQSGTFDPLEPGPISIECRGICGQVTDGQVTFYTLNPERGQFCNDVSALPDSQRIGPRSFAFGSRGFGYGHTCKVAAVYERNNALTFINLGLSSFLPRGGAMLTLGGARDCWLSPDNTVALVTFSDNVAAVYSVLTGKALARTNRPPMPITTVTINADTVKAGGTTWVLE
jgi:hypothetical protein